MSDPSDRNSGNNLRGNIKHKTLNTIESSVTRLLVSTKHLLESLTQWARREADDKFVSDAYVKLGNDFRAATRAFSGAGVDISDIGDVPQALRIILEAALSETPSLENLDRFLPNIRNIIVTLLQTLKAKQVKAKALSQESQPIPKADGDIREQKPEKHDSHPPPDKTAKKSTNDALSQLQKGNFISRRASKRFSAYQYAKLSANLPPSADLPTYAKGPTSESRISSEEKKNESNEGSDEPTPENRKSREPTKSHLFLCIDRKTRKVEVTFPVSLASVRLLFVEKFAYSPGTSTFPEILIKDHETGILYELEEQNIEDVKPGSLLTLSDSETANELDSWRKQVNESIERLTDRIEENNHIVVNEIREAINSIEIPQALPPQPSHQKVVQPEKTREIGNTVPSKLLSKEIDGIQRELEGIKAFQSSNREKMRSSVGELLDKVHELQESSAESTKSSNRAYVESCHLKLSEESDRLLTKVDDLQDLMEALRKDVAQRGVRIGEKQLKFTTKEIDDAKNALKDICEFMGKERSVWKRIWEAELDKVCEEQQFFNLQSDLTEDLKEDLKRIEETYDLIEQCSLEQSKQAPGKRNKVMAQIHIPEPGESLHDMKHAVLSEVNSVIPDHEKRLEAIFKAEKFRIREKELMQMSKFQEELGDFVEDNKFKNSGGFEELEKMRSHRDRENLKGSFGVF